MKILELQYLEVNGIYKYNGSVIIVIDGLRMLHIPKIKQTSISDDELKEKMFVWSYDSKNQSIEQSRDFIFEKLKKLFPDANVFVLVRCKNIKSSWSIRGHKSLAHFEGYGDTDVITCIFDLFDKFLNIEVSVFY